MNIGVTVQNLFNKSNLEAELTVICDPASAIFGVNNILMNFPLQY